MLSRFYHFWLIGIAVFLLSTCASEPPAEDEFWQEPVGTDEQNVPAAKPQSEEREKPPAPEEVDSAAKPWEPDTSMGSAVREDELIFDGESIKQGPEDSQDPIADAFSPNAGYESDEALTGKKRRTKSPGYRGAVRGQKMWVTADGINVRQGPSQQSKSVDTLRKGASVVVTRTTEGWSQIGPQRYVRAKYLSKKKP